MSRKRVGFGALILLSAQAAGAAVTQYNGVLGDPAVAMAFASVTSAHAKQFIDFDNDGLVVNGSTPIPPYHYLSQGVILSNLDVRTVADPSWTHSPPLGAWRSGFFDNPNAVGTISFTFTQPVASVGAFFNDVEGIGVSVTVHTTSGNELFSFPFQGGAAGTQFHGWAANANVIQQIDLTSQDFWIIDDVQFGTIPEPSGLASMLVPIVVATIRRRRACIARKRGRESFLPEKLPTPLSSPN